MSRLFLSRNIEGENAPGRGHLVKAVNNALLGAHMLVASEGGWRCRANAPDAPPPPPPISALGALTRRRLALSIAGGGGSAGLATVARHGVDVSQALKAINGSSGRSWVTM
jgi:3-hydroxyisobutyrate dehydrogenase-like beta-hydroxyacid dehydrogenase